MQNLNTYIMASNNNSTIEDPTPIFVDVPSQLNMNSTQLKKMVFIMNALEKGWTVKKSDDSYIFTKKHEGKREVFRENYLERFVQSNFDMSTLSS